MRYLLLLMTILAQTLLALVGSHLVTLMLLSVWHSLKYLEVLDSTKLFNLGSETLGRLESGNVVRGNGDGGVLGDITGHLLGALLHDETAEAAKIDVVLMGQRRLDALHESLDDSLHLHLFGTGIPGDFAHDVCFCHNGL